VHRQRGDETSMLSLYRRLIDLRRHEPALAVGTYRPVAASGTVLAYRRSFGGRELLVALNLGAAPQRLAMPADFAAGKVLVSASGMAEGRAHRHEIGLEANQALVLERADR
jgi:alpha-glucosidase